MTWFLFASLASISWGIGQVLIKKGFEHTNPLFNNFLSTIFGAILFSIFAFAGGINWALFPGILWLALLAATPNFIYYYAVEKGDISLTGTVVASYPLFVILLSGIFLGERIDIFQKLAIVLIITGGFLVSKPKKFTFRFESWVIWGLVSAILIGFGDFIGKISLARYDVYSFMFAYSIAYVISQIFNFLLDKKGRKIPTVSKRKLLPTLTGTFLLEVGMLFLYLALNSGKASLVSPISSSYVLITALLASVFLKEKISFTQVIGILLGGLGIILIGI